MAVALYLDVRSDAARASARAAVQTQNRSRGSPLASVLPKDWHAPRWWLGTPSQGGQPATGAWCIHEHEGAWNANTGNGYYGGMQFTLYTWGSVMGRVRPDIASPREQLYRAWLVWQRDGGSWREWGTRKVCGLT